MYLFFSWCVSGLGFHSYFKNICNCVLSECACVNSFTLSSGPDSLYLWSTLLVRLSTMLLILLKFSFLITLLLSSGFQSLSNSIFISSIDFLISCRCLSAIFGIYSRVNSCSLSFFKISFFWIFLSRIGSMDLVLEKFKTDGMSWFVMVLCFCTGLVHQ